MTKQLIFFFLVILKIGFTQTIAETIFISLGQAIASDGINKGPLKGKFHNGLIVINADTIKGQIKIAGGGVFFYNDSVEKLIKAKNKSLIRKVASFLLFTSNDPKKNYIKSKKITFVRLFAADTMITKKGFMDFIHIGKSLSFYRKIYSGSLEIYDINYCTDEYPGYIENGLAVLDNGKIIEPSSISAKKYLVESINNKFNKGFKASDFKRRLDVINWLKQNDINSVE